MNCGFTRNQGCRFLKVWGCDSYVKKLQSDKLEPKLEKCVFIGYQRRLLGTPSIIAPKARYLLLRIGSFLEKKFLSKEVNGRNIELDEVIVPSPELESSSSQKSVLVIPTPISEEANGDDHEASDQVIT